MGNLNDKEFFEFAKQFSAWSEWQENHQFKDYYIEHVFDVIKEQQKKYYTACEQHEHTVYEPLEEAVEKRLFPKLEQLILTDTRMGGKHEMKTRWHQNANVFCMDGKVYCGYQAAKGDIARELRCPLERPCDVVEEGSKFLAMIDDLSKLSAHDFVKKYEVDPPVNGFETFANQILTNIKTENVTMVDFNQSCKNSNEIRGFLQLEYKDDASLFSSYSFVNANPEYIGYNRLSLEGGKINYRDDFDDVFALDNMEFQVAFDKDITKEDAGYSITRATISMNDYIIIGLSKENVDNFEECAKTLTRFFNETIIPLHFDEEKKLFDTMMATKKAANIKKTVEER